MGEEASWEHPLTETFRDVLDVVESHIEAAGAYGLDALAARIEKALQEAQEEAAEELTDWVGPISCDISAGAEEYYYNTISGRSSWEDPREKWQYDLQVKYDLLVGFMVARRRRMLRRLVLQNQASACESSPRLARESDPSI